MSEELRPWNRPPASYRYVCDYLIREAHLSYDQVCIIEIYLLSQESLHIQAEIDAITAQSRSLSTPDGIEEERRRLVAERDAAIRNLADLETHEGRSRIMWRYAAKRHRYTREYENLQKALQEIQR